jgi:hypothetical protein
MNVIEYPNRAGHKSSPSIFDMGEPFLDRHYALLINISFQRNYTLCNSGNHMICIEHYHVLPAVIDNKIGEFFYITMHWQGMEYRHSCHKTILYFVRDNENRY